MEKDLIARVRDYWDTRAEGYSLDVREELEGKSGQEWLRRITENAPSESFQRVLDIGCGPGFFGALLGANGYRVTGIDCTEGMLAEARKNAEKAGAQVTLLQMDAEAPDFPDGSFDLIVSRNLVWNLAHPEKAYRRWMRLLRPGGKIILMDGNYYLHYALPAYRTDTSGSGHRHMEGIDVSVIDGIARELPLSFRLRPDWDRETFSGLGGETQILERFTAPGADGEEIVRSFILMVVKK